MPPSTSRKTRLPVATVVTVTLVVVAGLFAQPGGPGLVPPESAVTVTGKRTNGPPFEGALVAPSLRLNTDFGVAEINVAKMRSADFRVGKTGEVTATFELEDHSRMQGKFRDAAIPFVIGDATEAIEVATLSSLKFKHVVPFSLVAVILGLVTLSAMEIVLGVDNVIFLAILVGKLPDDRQRSARNIGLGAALGTRLLLLFSLSWLLGLTRPIFTLPELPFLNDPEARDISWRDLILIAGGLFLIYKSVRELHQKVEEAGAPEGPVEKTARFATVIAQIAVIDIVFSLDSVITAVGMVEDVWIMVVAMCIAMAVMLFFAGTISHFVDRNPTIKVLALSFLILIGALLVAESLGQHLDKGYIYFAMAFAVVIEVINMQLRKPKKPKDPPVTPPAAPPSGS
jgi:predicted tellurium resistance membrane protein TerC